MCRNSHSDNKPRWFTQKYSRPTRRVVSQFRRYYSTGHRDEWKYFTYDVLECGHVLPDNSAIDGSQPAKHRRCRECQPTGEYATDAGAN